nr:divergent PAP2 family protein [Maliibacterium massiliense]
MLPEWINPVLVPSLVAWFIAQVSKMIVIGVKEKRMDFTRMVGSGGMPSSHSATVVAMAVACGQVAGYSSVSFGIAAVLAIVVMYDASGVRQAAGKQAKVLNEIVDTMFENGNLYVAPEKLKELLGHTRVEVFVGALLGALVALVMTWGR